MSCRTFVSYILKSKVLKKVRVEISIQKFQSYLVSNKCRMFQSKVDWNLRCPDLTETWDYKQSRFDWNFRYQKLIETLDIKNWQRKLTAKLSINILQFSPLLFLLFLFSLNFSKRKFRGGSRLLLLERNLNMDRGFGEHFDELALNRKL